MEKIHILYVDDELHNLNTFKANFRTEYEIYICQSAAEALELLKEKTVEIIITDQRMPGMTGVEFLESIVSTYPDPIKVIATGYADIEVVINAINKGRINYFISKPWNSEEIRSHIEKMHEVYTLKRENKVLIKKLLEVNARIEALLIERSSAN